MSAINVWLSADQAHVFTDGLLTHPDGMAVMTKTFPIPHLSCAVATRGSARMLHMAAMVLCHDARWFEDVRPVLAGLQTAFADLPEAWCNEALAMDFDIVVAGVGLAGPAAYHTGNHGNHGLEPWTVLDIRAAFCTPTVDQAMFDQVFGADDPLPLMPALMKAQTADPRVGGFCQRTSVSRRGITTGIVGHLTKDAA